MKIVRIIARLNVGGPARHVVWLTKALQDQEFQSVLVAGSVPEGEEDMSYFAFENGVKPIFIPEMSREISLKDDIVSFLKIYKILLREKPDIIHTHTAKAGTLGRLAGLVYRWFTFGTLIGRPRRTKMVHTYHGHIFHSYYGCAKTKLFLTIEKILALLATDKIIVISKQQFEEIHKKYGVGISSQFSVIPLGIDLDVFRGLKENRKAIRREFNLKDEEVAVGIIGRLTEIKNHRLFLRVAKICKALDERLRFFVIGDGNLKAELRREAEDLGITDKLVFMGNREDISFYAALDVVALTSLNEGTPLSLIEAMASEVPVISTIVGGVLDLLGKRVEQKSGFCIFERGIGVWLEQENIDESFSMGLLYLIRNPKLQKNLAKAGKEYVFSCYSKRRLVEDISSLYKNLLFED